MGNRKQAREPGEKQKTFIISHLLIIFLEQLKCDPARGVCRNCENVEVKMGRHCEKVKRKRRREQREMGG